MIPFLGVAVLNRPDLLHRMLASIDHPVKHLVIVDNGRCLPLGQQVVQNVQHTDVIRMPANLGVAGSWNALVKSSPFAPYWLIVNSDAHFPAGSLARFDAEARPDALVLSGGAPRWCAFALGEQVVSRVGLFDEALHPAYVEDLDFERRVESAGLPIISSGIPVHHDNSSTIGSSPTFRARNDSTFSANHDYYRDKVAREDMTAGTWSLERRRSLSWD